MALESSREDETDTAELTAEERNEAHLVAMRAQATSGKGNVPAAVDTNLQRRDMNGFKVGAGPVLGVSEAAYHPSPTVNERNVESIADYDEFKDVLAPAMTALSNVRTGLEAIDQAHYALKRDTSKTPEQRLLLVSVQAIKKFDVMYKTLMTTAENYDKAVEHLEKQLDAPITSGAVAATNDELRTVIRGMKREERMKVLNDAIRNGDDQIINATLGVHPLITGLDPVMHKVLTRQVQEKRSPDTVRRINATREAIKKIQAAVPVIRGEIEKAQRGTFAQVHKLQGQSDASAKALAAILGKQTEPEITVFN